ncbi:hypothetical protein JVU11DRAFT_7423 [Chiua virens]|nr:hypothetical protein JVU11DRAFT_7423 [Chiua virens]
MILKDREVYLEETMGTVPPYVIVSQVWGVVKEYMRLPTVPWPVPISDKSKWDAIQDFCRKQHVKWIWLDIVCINQSRTPEAELEKGREIPKMNQYYPKATACLVIPQNYSIFNSAYARLMEILSTFVDSGASVKDNARSIWDGIAMLEKVADDVWFWRVWTYQELLLPKKHVLLDGQELRFDRLERCLSWYYTITHSGTIERPEGGNIYEFIDLGQFGFKGKPWGNLLSSWNLKATHERDGYLDLLPAMAITTKRFCTFPIDRILGIYGLLKEEDRVPLHEPNADFLVAEDNISVSLDSSAPSSIQFDHLFAHTSPSQQVLRLERLWERTLVKTVEEGRVWPLLHEGMIADAPSGTNWIPRIVNSAWDEVHDVCDQYNPRRATVTKAGVQLTVRVLGHISGASVSIGDGTGELNKMFSCAWALITHGFNAQPILQMLNTALARKPEGTTEDDQTKLDQALHAPSLAECFLIVEQKNFRDRLFHAGGIAGWNRTIFAAQPGPNYSGADGTYVFLGWISNQKAVDSKQCWILDVTANPQGAKRWVIANKIGPNTFHKIGSVVANTLPAFTRDDGYALVVLD